MKRPSRLLLILSLAMNLFAVVGSFAIVAKKGGRPWLRRKVAEVFRPQQAGRSYPGIKQSVLDQLPIGPDDTVFLGDSILALGEWHELLRDHRVKNRAISGAGTHAVWDMLDRAISGKPRHVVLMCGINNFHRRMPYKQTAEDYARIVATISSQSRRMAIWMLPVLPVNEAPYRRRFASGHPGISTPDRHDIKALNALIEGLAIDRPRVHFVDLHVLLNSTGELRKDCTSDGLLQASGVGRPDQQISVGKLGAVPRLTSTPLSPTFQALPRGRATRAPRTRIRIIRFALAPM